MIICGDFREHIDALHRQHKIGAVVVDPPYGVVENSAPRVKKSVTRQLFQNDESIAGDHSTQLSEWIYYWCQSEQVPLIMFFSPYLPSPGKFRSLLVWSKGDQVGIGGDRKTCWKRDFEMIGVAFNSQLRGKRDSAVIQIPSDVQKPSGHFCEKPIALMSYLIKKILPEGKLVLDPCCGSGSTGVAATQLGNPFIGVEVDPKWCRVAEDRIARTSKVNTFFR